MKNYITIGGGLLTVISLFLPFVSAMGISITGLQSLGNVAYLWIGCGAVIAIAGFMGNKIMNIVGLLLGLAVAGVAIKYKMDAGSMTAIGLWLMIAGGVLAVVGSVMGLMKKAA